MFADRGYLDRLADAMPPPAPLPVVVGGAVPALKGARLSRSRTPDWRTAEADVDEHLYRLRKKISADRDMPRNVTIDLRPNNGRMSEVILNYMSVIVDELVTGSLRYGFPAGRGGRIGLYIEVCPSYWELTVEDSATAGGCRGSAMGKVRHVVAGLGGTMDLPHVIGGHRWVITVPWPGQGAANGSPIPPSD
jgi:hypothetical protein